MHLKPYKYITYRICSSKKDFEREKERQTKKWARERDNMLNLMLNDHNKLNDKR